ncbi:MAG: aldehyde ferredoxin oxidoreductase [Firmicutes bacterium]|jgi:aldehyde:ferredoxin oxidoreductase|nr:aldehyde ferredoxin oxidoreductase [Bacillota bacterium]MDH7494703.1 aldehyde ferredoxin oxidoreductase C-terminal domain-containing protein [Bacillota bacterium]
METSILRIDMQARSMVREEAGESLAILGGRGLTSRIVLDEVRPGCDPLGRHNKLVIAPGLVGGTAAPCSGRISVGGKSPLTGGIKESNAGGVAGHKLARLGVKAIVFENKPAGGAGPFVLVLTKDSAELVPCPELAGVGVYESVARLRRKYGKRPGIMVIGPAGENALTAAGISVTNSEGEAGRYCGRGGMGALMGSKGIKALVIDDSGTPAPESRDKKRFLGAVREIVRLIRETPQTAEVYRNWGTAALVATTNALGGLPTRNFSTGRFEGADRISAVALRELILARGGLPTHSCMPGCPIGCSNRVPRADGSELVSPLEYETIGLLGSNCGIDDLDAIGEMNRLCNDLGVDTIDIGGAVGIAMEAGLLRFGDAAGAIELIREIGKGTVLGRVIGHGGAVTARVLGVRRVPAVKGQIMPAYEPRGIKGLGVTFATSPMGADHTSGNTVRQQIDHHSPAGQTEASRSAQLSAVLYDMLGICLFVGPAVRDRIDLLADLVSSHLGIPCTADVLRALARQTIMTEREFNRRAGFTSVHDRLPEHFTEERNPATGTVFDVSDEDMDTLWE